MGEGCTPLIPRTLHNAPALLKCEWLMPTGSFKDRGASVMLSLLRAHPELVRELELYVGAGFTPAEALQAATIVPARLVGADSHTGTIGVGKDADLVLVDGDPSRKIGDLRHTRIVLMDGKVMEADKLRAAVGFSAIPAWARAE